LDITQIMFKRKNNGSFKNSYGDASFLWSARRYDNNNAYYQWLGDGSQDDDYRQRELSVRPVRRLSIQSFNDLFNVTFDKPYEHETNYLDAFKEEQCKSGDVTTREVFEPCEFCGGKMSLMDNRAYCFKCRKTATRLTTQAKGDV
jgi:hypothetical protein